MILGISGFAGSGKDTVADFLVKNHGFVKVAFADKIKRIAKDLFDFTDEQLWGSSEHRNKPDKRYCSGVLNLKHMLSDEELKEYPDGLVPQYLSPRKVLQLLGTQFGRESYKDVWVDYALRTAHKLLSDPHTEYSQQLGVMSGSGFENYYKGVVISDVRFANEIKAIKCKNGSVIRVIRPGAGLNGEASEHQSEAEMRDISDDAFNFIINNDKSLKDLEESVDKIITKLVHAPGDGFVKFGH